MRVRFYNSTEYEAFWKTLLKEIEKYGCDVSHPYALDQRTYLKEGGLALRAYKFAQIYLRYCLTILFTRRNAADVYVATTSPFCAPALLRFRHGRSSRTVVLLYDLFPDALELSGMVKPKSLSSRVLSAFTRYALTKSSATVFLGDHLQKHAESRYGSVNNPLVIPVGADGAPFSGNPPTQIPLGETVRILYCGNLGRAHDHETVMQYMTRGSTEGVQWLFHSHGKGYAELKRQLNGQAENPHFQLRGPLDDSQWVNVMRTSHVALVTMLPGWETVVMPSKTYSAMVAGQAILAICPPESDLAELVRKHDCGWVIPPGDVPKLEEVVARIAADRTELLKKRTNSFEAGHSLYDCSKVAKQWHALLKDLSS